jgi:hypothetical protein
MACALSRTSLEIAMTFTPRLSNSGLQAAEFEQVLQADRAMQAAVEDHQVKFGAASSPSVKSPWSSVGTLSAGTAWRGIKAEGVDSGVGEMFCVLMRSFKSRSTSSL